MPRDRGLLLRSIHRRSERRRNETGKQLPGTCTNQVEHYLTLMLWGQNMEEVHMVVRIARRYEQKGLNFCIITFYDPQRAAITEALKNEKLPTGCVYNVDSFQGINHTLVSVTL